jgi:hypothetical protein
MNARMRRRLARLEQTASPAETVHVWAGAEALADTQPHVAAYPKRTFQPQGSRAAMGVGLCENVVAGGDCATISQKRLPSSLSD